MRPRSTRYLRRPDGRILSVRLASDPVFDVLWLQAAGPREFFADLDRTRRLAHGGTIEDEAELVAAEARLRNRFARRRR